MKKSPHYRIARPPEKSIPADNLPVKIRPARAAAGRGGFLPVNCRPGGDFSGGGQSYNGAPACRCRSVSLVRRKDNVVSIR